MTVKVCVSISPETANEAVDSIKEAKKYGAGFIEVRLDILKDYNRLGDIAKSSNVPMIATIRSIKDRGQFLGNELERHQTLVKAAENGFDYVDVELTSPHLQKTINKLNEKGVKPIVSFHDFNRTLSIRRMNRILDREIDSGADICKIVTTATAIEDNLTLLNFTSSGCKRIKVVSFAMGELGKLSRLMSPLFGAYFTIASLKKKKETAPGQLTIEEMQIIYQNMGLA